jgi:LmbE family N-acetylglucosaminyl deacetylase
MPVKPIATRVLASIVPADAPFSRPAVVVAPHPDDESFGCGGVIAEKRARGAPVQVVFATDGGASHGSLELKRKEALVARRRREALAALAALGVPEAFATFLELPDGGAADAPPEVREAAIARVCVAMERVRAEEVFVTFRRDGHKDHEAAFALARAALQRCGRRVDLYEYPIWLERVEPPTFMRARVVHLDARALAKKRAAVAAHASQLEILPAGFADRFLTGWELFFVLRGVAA